MLVAVKFAQTTHDQPQSDSLLSYYCILAAAILCF